MISVGDIRKQALKAYPSFLSAEVSGGALFPKDIRFRKVRPSEPLEDFKELRDGLRLLRESSNEHLGYGYMVDYEEIVNRNVGKQRFPTRIYFAHKEDYLKFIGKEKEAALFVAVVHSACAEFTQLQDWARRYPLTVIENLTALPDLLKVCRYFSDNPSPNLYIRELPIAVDTKFIERNKRVLSQMLNVILGPKVKQTESDFERRYGLKYTEPLLRLRILDPELSRACLSGLRDISIPLSEFRNISIHASMVFIMENKTNLANIMNFLTLPNVSGAIAVFGGGYGVHLLKDTRWLKEKRILYWGDIDCHGFEILSMLRGYFPRTESVMMDFDTFDAFKVYRVPSEMSKASSLANLTEDEARLYEYLRECHGDNRLEQERIPHSFAVQKFHAVIGG